MSLANQMWLEVIMLSLKMLKQTKYCITKYFYFEKRQIFKWGKHVLLFGSMCGVLLWFALKWHI